MKIDDREVPDGAIVAWRHLLTKADEKRLTGSVAHHKNFLPGFRPGRIPGHAVRAKLLSMLEQKGAIPEPLLSALQSVGITNSIIKVFSKDVISEIEPALYAYFGEITFASMLLDERSDVRGLGFAGFQRTGTGAATDEDSEGEVDGARIEEQHKRNAAAQRLTSQLAPFIRDFTQVIGDARPVGEAERAAPAHQDDNSGIQEQKHRLSKLESDLRRAQSHAERLQAEIQEKREEIEKAKRSRDKAKDQLAETSQRLALLESEFQSRVEAETQRRINAQLRPWLYELINKEQICESLNKSNLLSDVAEALKRQAANDKKYGIVTLLQSKLDELKKAKDSLQSALDLAIRPRDEIPSLINRIDLEIDSLEKQLGRKEQPKLGGMAAQLAKEIKLASLETLPSTRAQVIRATDLGGLSISESKDLLNLIFERSDQLYCAANLSSASSWKHDPLIALPNNHLRALMANGERCRIIIDGHNVLFRLTDLFSDFYENGYPKSLARSQLKKRLMQLIQRFASVLIDLWFDGQELTNETLHENFRVHFSGGAGTNRADDSIVSFLKAIKKQELGVTFVVTDDNELRNRCRDVGARALACGEIASLLSL